MPRVRQTSTSSHSQAEPVPLFISFPAPTIIKIEHRCQCRRSNDSKSCLSHDFQQKSRLLPCVLGYEKRKGDSTESAEKYSPLEKPSPPCFQLCEKGKNDIKPSNLQCLRNQSQEKRIKPLARGAALGQIRPAETRIQRLLARTAACSDWPFAFCLRCTTTTTTTMFHWFCCCSCGCQS